MISVQRKRMPHLKTEAVLLNLDILLMHTYIIKAQNFLFVRDLFV